MKTTQAWAWLTAGVLALGLNGFYHDGGAVWAHRIADQVADRSEAVVDLASERVDGLMGKARLVAARDETASCRLATAVARFQTKIARTQTGMAHFEAMSARQEVVLARVEEQRARIEAQVARVRLAPVAFDAVVIPAVACPRVRVNAPRVRVPRLPSVRIPAPVVQVELGGKVSAPAFFVCGQVVRGRPGFAQTGQSRRLSPHDPWPLSSLQLSAMMFNAIPACAKEPRFCLSLSAKKSYSLKAQRFLDDN
jgi:hypothetical protein